MHLFYAVLLYNLHNHHLAPHNPVLLVEILLLIVLRVKSSILRPESLKTAYLSLRYDILKVGDK